MISLEEKVKVLKLLAELSDMEEEKKVNRTSNIDVSNRLRDEQGRFLPNESRSEKKEELPSRSIRLVKVKGTYGTYLVKDREPLERAWGTVVTFATILFLLIIL